MPVAIAQRDLVDFCQRHRIRKLALFGSVLREDFRPDSDIDVLVEFESGRSVSLLTWAAHNKSYLNCSGGKPISKQAAS